VPIRDGDEAAVQALAGDASAEAAVAHLGDGEEAGPQAPPPDLTAAAFFDDLGLIGLVGAQTFEHGHRRAAVRNAE
jgi:hypothetical protein